MASTRLAGSQIASAVIDARHAHGVMGLQLNKSNACDAARLAKIAQTGFYKPVSVGSIQSQERQAFLNARKQLVKGARSMENTIRGLLSSFGISTHRGVPKFIDRVRLSLADNPALIPATELLLEAVSAMKEQLSRIDRFFRTSAKNDEACRLLMTVPGVAHITAEAFIATVDDPSRFSSSRDVGAYFGLTTRRYQSGERDASGRILKIGDSTTRALLHNAANSFMLHVQRTHPLSDWVKRIKKRSGHRTACVALARKFAVLMRKMLMTGEVFRWPETAKSDA